MSVNQATLNGTARRELPMPLVRPTQHPLIWLRNKSELLVAALILAYFGTLIVAAVYYLLFEKNPSMKDAWHGVVPNAALRHNIRNVAEGFLGGLLAQQVVWNHYKLRQKSLTRLDRLEIRWHIPNVKDGRFVTIWQLLATPFLALLYATPGFLTGLGITWLIRHHILSVSVPSFVQAFGHSLDHIPTGHSLWAKFQTTWAGNWDKKLMGLGSSFLFGRRPVKAVFDDLQLWFAEQRVYRNKPVRRYHPPTFQARYNDVLAHLESIPSGRHGKWWQQPVALTVFGLGIVLAGYGFHVLTFVAGA